MSNWKKTKAVPWWVACFLLGIVIVDEFWGLRVLGPSPPAFEFPSEKTTYELVITGPVQFARHGVRVQADLVHPVAAKTQLIVYQGIPLLRSGDRVRVWGKIKPVSGFRNPGLKDPIRQAEREGIYWTIRVASAESVEVLGQATGWWPVRWIETWRYRIREEIQGAAPLIRGIVLGDRSGFSEMENERFRRSGLMHLLAISGQHVGLVALLFYLLARILFCLVPSLSLWVPLQKLAWLVACLPVTVYVVLAGAPVSACRAWLMLGCFLMAFLWDQSRDAMTNLALAALLIVLWQPAELFTLAFHLSFLAVTILIVSVGGSNRSFWGRVGSLIAASFFINLLLALPLAYTFGEVVLTGVVANLIALPLFSFWILPGALVSVLLLPIGTGAAQLVLCFTSWGALVFERLADYFAGLNGSFSLPLTGLQLFSCSVIVITYILFPTFLIRYRPLVLLGAAILLGWVSSFEDHDADRLSMTLLDVGQGDAIVLSVANRHYLIDGGGFYIPHDRRDFPIGDVGERVIVPYLKRHRIDRLEGIVLSHPHPDHYEGLVAVSEHLPVSHFYWNGDAFNDSQYAYFMEALERQKTRFHVIDSNTPARVDGRLKLQWLNPQPDAADEFNDRSVVLRIDYGEICILLTGDIETRAEYRLTGSGLEPCDILKVAHHGSRTSSTDHFLDQVQPQLALMSVGRGNPFGHPHPTVEERYERRGIPVLRTDLHGAITVETDGRSIEVKTVVIPPYPNSPTRPPSSG